MWFQKTLVLFWFEDCCPVVPALYIAISSCCSGLWDVWVLSCLSLGNTFLFLEHATEIPSIWPSLPLPLLFLFLFSWASLPVIPSYRRGRCSQRCLHLLVQGGHLGRHNITRSWLPPTGGQPLLKSGVQSHHWWMPPTSVTLKWILTYTLMLE